MPSTSIEAIGSVDGEIQPLKSDRSGRRALYHYIFFTNVLRLLSERGMTKKELSKRSGVSISFLSDLTCGRANPSLKVMEDVARALDASLPLLLDLTDLDRAALDALANRKVPPDIPKGYERITAVLPEHQAFIVRKWNASALKKIQGSLFRKT